MATHLELLWREVNGNPILNSSIFTRWPLVCIWVGPCTPKHDSLNVIPRGFGPVVEFVDPPPGFNSTAVECVEGIPHYHVGVEDVGSHANGSRDACEHADV